MTVYCHEESIKISEFIIQKTAIILGSHTVHERVVASRSKTSIVLIHGLGVSGDYYLPFAEEMNEHYDVYIIDLPGFGGTPKPHHSLSIIKLSHVVVDYIAEKQLQNVIIVGQSMGCQVVAHAVADSPDLFTKMILLAPTINKDERRFSTQTLRLLQDSIREPLPAIAVVLRDYLRMGIRRYLSTTRSMLADHIEKTLVNCHVPILIVRGENDKIVPRHWTEYLAAIHTVNAAVELPNSPHLLHYKKPEELVAVCRRFIEK